MRILLLCAVINAKSTTYEEILNSSVQITEQRHDQCSMKGHMSKYTCTTGIDHYKRCERRCDKGKGISKRTCECYRRRGPIKIYDVNQCKWKRHENKCWPKTTSIVLYPQTTTSTTTTTTTMMTTTSTTTTTMLTTTTTTVAATTPSPMPPTENAADPTGVKLKFAGAHSMYCSDLIAHSSDWQCSSSDYSKGTNCSRKCGGTHFSMLSKCTCSRKTGDCKWRFKIPSICVKLNDKFTYEHPELVKDYLAEPQVNVNGEMENDFVFVEEEEASHNEPDEPEEDMATTTTPVPSTKPPRPVFKRRTMRKRLQRPDPMAHLAKLDSMNLFPATVENASKLENGEINGIFAARSAEEFEQFLRTFNDWDQLTLVAVEKGHLQHITNDATIL